MFKKLWSKVKIVLKQLWSLVTDYQWDFSVYKVSGIACLVLAIIFAFATGKATGFVSGLFLILLAFAFGAASMILFGTARKDDAAQMESEKK